MLDDDYGDQQDAHGYWDDEDIVSIRPTGSRIKKAFIALGFMLVIGVILLLVIRGWVNSQLDPAGAPTEEVEVIVETGATTGVIASQLEEAEVVPSSFFFRYFTRWKNEGDFQAGEYTFRKNMSAEEAVVVLNNGPRAVEAAKIVVREGAWLSEIIPELAEQLPNVTEAELQEVLDTNQITPRYRPEGQDSWEGFLFPDTYEVDEEASALEVLGILNNQFARVTGDLGYGRAERPNNLTPYEVLIVASLIESEAKTDADRPKIARVIYNRLNANDWLGIDATLVYDAQVRGQVPTEEQIVTRTPYNTRAPRPGAAEGEGGVRGLPPTPIGVPGRASLDAALNPEDGDWFFYVLADAEGNHFFTSDSDEFEAQKARSREAGLL